MSSDSSFTYLHLHSARHANLFEEFSKPKLPVEDIVIADRHRPLNPDEEEDIVPDQRAAFGIQRATQKSQEPAWRDLGLASIMTQGPPSTQSSAGAANTSRVETRR